MTNLTMGGKLATVTTALVLALGGSSAFATATWNFSSGTGGCLASGQPTGYGQQGTNSGTFGNTYKCKAATGTGPDVTVSAWGQETGQTGFRTAYVSPQGGSGFGIASRAEGISVSAPDHSMDNVPTTSVPDLFLLSFTSAVALDTVTMGWTQSDADFTLMAYKGTAAPTTFLQGKTAATLTTGGATSGWALVQNSGDADPVGTVGYAGTGTPDITRSVNVNSPAVTSSWWLISAYHSGFGGGNLDHLADYIKLFGIASKTVPPGTRVPEPGTLALMGVAMLGIIGTRRRMASQPA